MATLSVQELVAQIKSAKPANDSERQALHQAGRDLAGKTEDAFEAVNRIVYAPQLLYVTKVGIDLGLFTTLSSQEGKTLSIDDLAQNSPVHPEPLLVKRVLRFLASHYLVSQVDAEHYSANTLTKALATAAYEGGVVHSADCLSLCAEALPKFLADTKYRNPIDSAHSPFQLAMNTDLQAWTWSLTQPELTASFMKWMGSQTRPGETWIDAIDVAALLKNTTSESIIFVDVGGSVGHQSVAFKQRFPNTPGRVIVQDLEGPTGAAIPYDGVKNVVVDFWQPQKVKGARIYYMRNILHDWTDEKAIELLKITRTACGPDSVIVIDEMVLPDVDAHWRATAMDINMLSTVAALERTETDWRLLLKSAGLSLRDFKTYQRDTAWSVIIAA